MPIEDVKKLDRFEQLIHWILERHKVYKKKEKGKPRPYTDDVIIEQNRFTNVYRELDKTTKWYADNIRTPFSEGKVNGSRSSVIFATIAFRWFNRIETGQILLGHQFFTDWDSEEVKVTLRYTKPIFTGAFLISNTGSTLPKLEHVSKFFIDPCWDKRKEMISFFREKQQTLAESHKYLQQYPGFGGTGFMAAQVIADLKYTKYLEKAPDWWTWCSPGPGSIKGLNWLYGRGLVSTPVQDWLGVINRLRDKVNKRVEKEGMPPLHAQDIQNSCCELSKYVFVMNGGRSKRKYK